MTTIDFENPSDEFVRSIDIHELLPQQEPFVMIGTLTHYDAQKTVSQLTIADTNIFVTEGRFSASGLIENIAQTCAARIGYINKYILKKGIQLGFIGAIKDLEVFGLPNSGDNITTEINVKGEIFGMILADAKVTSSEKTLVSAEMKIAVKDEDTESK